MKIIIRSYAVRGFRVVVIGVHMKLKALKDCNECRVVFNVVSKDEHVPNIERWYRVVKERCI